MRSEIAIARSMSPQSQADEVSNPAAARSAGLRCQARGPEWASKHEGALHGSAARAAAVDSDRRFSREETAPTAPSTPWER